MVVVAFAAVMAAGGAVLSLDISTAPGVDVSFFDGLFTAVSAASVTGLTRFDTADSFSWFGEGVTLALVQLGGLGVTMYAGMLILIAGRRLGMRGRQFFGMELAGSGSEVAGAPQLLRRVMIYTAAAETITFIALLPWFVMGVRRPALGLDGPLPRRLRVQLRRFRHHGRRPRLRRPRSPTAIRSR